MVDFGQLRVILGLESAQFKAGLADAKAGLVSWRDETNKSTGDMAKWGAAIALTAVPLIAIGYELVNLTQKAAEFGKSIKDNSRDLGLSTKEYQQWTHAAIAAGSSAEEMTGSIRMLTIRLKEAKDPESDVSRYLEAMKISAFDANGSLRDTNSILMDLLPAINALPPGMQRNQASMVFFGKGFNNIADLASLSREQIQKLKDMGVVFSDEKLDNMDAMSVEMALLNREIEIMSVDLGEDLIPLAQDMIEIFKDMEPVIKGVAGTLHEAATGTTMMVQGLQLLYTQWQYGMDSPQMKKLQSDVQAYAQGEYNERQGISDKPGKSILDLQMEAQIKRENELKIRAKKEAEKSDPNAMTSFEITRSQLELDTLNKVTIPEQKLELETLKKAYATMGDHGSEAAKKVNRDITELTNKIAENTNKVVEMTDKLGKAGSSIAKTGGLTYNEMFKSSIQTGGVGPDLAGYSDLSNMSAEELQAVVEKGKLGGSQGFAEKAQSYLDRMKAGGGTTGKEPPATQADKEKKIYNEKTQALTKYGTDTLDLYMVQEQQDLTHWTATTELLKLATENMTKNWLEYVVQVGSNPAIHNVGVVVWDKTGPDWDPYSTDEFMQTARMATVKAIQTNFKSADFGALKFSAKPETPKSGDTTIKVIVPQETPAGEHATTQANSRGLAKTVV